MHVGDSVVIVSRHPAAIAFLREKLRDYNHAIPVVEMAQPSDVAGMHVYGNVPLHLASDALSVSAIEFHGSPPRGQEYSLADMEDSGAHLTRYVVQRELEPERGVML